MTIEEMQTAILDAISKRDSLVTEYRNKVVLAARAEHKYEQEHAKAMVKNLDGKNAEERKARTALAVDNESFQAKLQDAEKDGLKEALRAVADQINAMQSLLRVERLEIEAIQYGQRNGA